MFSQQFPFRAPLRRAYRRLRRLRLAFRTKAIILVYHRVADPAIDPWKLGVSPENFSRQMEVLRREFHPISLRQLTLASSDRSLPPRPVVVTFDDGYADNYLQALPRLRAFEIPATVFVSTGFLGIDHNLWWDDLAALLLSPSPAPERIHLTIAGQRIDLFLPASVVPSQVSRWAAWEPVPGPREAAYLELHRRFLGLTAPQREEALRQIREVRGIPKGREHRCLTEEELRLLAGGPEIEIGAHTVNHPVLSELDGAEQLQEIAGGKRRLEELTGMPVRSFAYPYGKRNHYSRFTKRAVRDCGLTCACSNFGGPVATVTDRFALPRFQPMDWDVPAFRAMLQAWSRE